MAKAVEVDGLFVGVEARGEMILELTEDFSGVHEMSFAQGDSG